MVPGTNHDVLVAYFSRAGNAAVSAGDSSSSGLKINADGTTEGNAQKIARWIAAETGGDLFLIQTEYTSRGLQGYRKGRGRAGYGSRSSGSRGHVDNMEGYKMVYLVYPTWHYTLPAPVYTFLDSYDLSGKVIYACNTSGGSRFADTLDRIHEAQPHASVKQGLSLSEGELNTNGAEQKVRDFVKMNH